MREQEIFALERPVPRLLTYYFLQSLFGLVFMPLFFLPLFFKYKTLRYRFDEKGISMSWGILFRRETYLTYQKIQDIHLTRNIIERWLSLGTLQVQTASGSSGAEMSIVGIKQLESLRDFIYARMKGHDEESGEAPATQTAARTSTGEELALLREIAEQLAAINARLEDR